jgi:hypothetical protein
MRKPFRLAYASYKHSINNYFDDGDEQQVGQCIHDHNKELHTHSHSLTSSHTTAIGQNQQHHHGRLLEGIWVEVLR